MRVDPATATVWGGRRLLTGDVDHAMRAFGLAAAFGVVSTMGVEGLTLSTGRGYPSRQYGVAADCLVKADVVLADESSLTAPERASRAAEQCGASANVC
jgi:FAD/FMN-containing dehydrogenase